MNPLDTFALLYRADTAQAMSAIDKLDKAAKKPGKSASDASSQLTEGMKRTTKETNGAIDSVTKFSREMDHIVSTSTSAGTRVTALGGVLKSFTTGPVAVFAAGLVAVTLATKAGMEAAQQASKDAVDLRNKAASVGMTEGSALRAQMLGTKLGISRDEMMQASSNLLDRAANAKLAMARPDLNSTEYRRALMMKRYGVNPVAANGEVASMDRLNQQMIKGIRAIDKREGREKAMAVAMDLFGQSANTTEKILNASSSQVNRLGKELDAEIAKRLQLQVAARKLADEETKFAEAKKKMADEMASKVTPALTRLVDAFTGAAGGNGMSLASILGSTAAAVLDLTTAVVKFVDSVIGAAKTLYKNTVGAFEDKTDEAHVANKVLSNLERNKITQEYLARNNIKNVDAMTADQKTELQNEWIKAAKAKNPEAFAIAKQKETDAAKERHDEIANFANTKLKNMVMDQFRTTDFMNGKKVERGVTETRFQAALEEAIKNKDVTKDNVEFYLKTIIERQKISEKQREASTKIQQELLAAVTPLNLMQSMSAWAAGMGKSMTPQMGIVHGQIMGVDRAGTESRIWDAKAHAATGTLAPASQFFNQYGQAKGAMTFAQDREQRRIASMQAAKAPSEAVANFQMSAAGSGSEQTITFQFGDLYFESQAKFTDAAIKDFTHGMAFELKQLVASKANGIVK